MEEPIACTLSSGDYAARKDEIGRLARRALRSREPVARGARLVFTADADTERELRDVIAAEATCCAFLNFRLDRVGDELRLDVTGPEPAQPIIAELFA